ncbi:MAG TPA: disulfide bond formation protein DsbA [Gammaproteobacteria bacterium]|nr:disulfide bond formation protein DsbA [Gammaproteobacteria bacterium]|tara:strand:- start:1145 stop:1747 length:603 start_codon:yes stop_codon:yes gene_type:complete
MKAEFLFDFGSPNAYLSHLVIPKIEQRTGVKFEYIPVLLGGVFKATNNVSPAISLKGIKNKGEYQGIETQRFLKKHDISNYQRNPYFPVNTLQVMRGAIFAKQANIFQQYINEIYRHMWENPKKMDDPETFREALIESKLPADDIMNGINSAEVKGELIQNTNEAVERGVFGSPSFFVDDDLYFGKDKLVEVEEAIVSAN